MTWRLELFNPATGSSISRAPCDTYFRAVEQATDHAVACFAGRAACRLLWTTEPSGWLTKLAIREDGGAVFLIARIDRGDDHG